MRKIALNSKIAPSIKTIQKKCTSMAPPAYGLPFVDEHPVQLKSSADYINDSANLFQINTKLSNRYTDYTNEIKQWKNEADKKTKAQGLVHWASHYHQEAAGSDAELRRSLYHEKNYKTNNTSLGTSNETQPDIHGTVGGKKRAEEVKAVASADPKNVKGRLNDAIAQLSNTRSDQFESKKAVIYIYHTRNPFPFDSIDAGSGKKESEIIAQAKVIVGQMRKKTIPNLQFKFVDVNMFNAKGVSIGTTSFEVDWPNSEKSVAADRKVGIQVGAGDSPYRKK
jgi:hypothetical protein